MTRNNRFIQACVNFFEDLLQLNRSVEGLIVDVVSSYSPWLAPAIPAYMTWRSMQVVLEFPWWMALIGAAVIETLGLSSIQTTIYFYNYNQTKGISAPKAPVWLSVITSIFYLTVVIASNVVIELYPQATVLVKALLSSLSICSGVIIAMRSGQVRRERAIAQLKEERRNARLHPESEISLKVSESFNQSVQQQMSKPRTWHNLQPHERFRALSMTAEQIQKEFGVSNRTAYHWLEHGNNGHEE